MIELPEKEKAKGSAGRKFGARSLTVSQKAEAAALWRSGSVTLDDLARKFKKRPETFSRLFARMGIEKGSGVAAAMKKAEEAIAAKTLTDTEETLKRISQVRDTHFRMSQQLAVMAFREITQAKAAELNIGALKDTMAVLKMASDVIGNSRKELFEILNVEKHDASVEMEDLPDLMVRELTSQEIVQLQDIPEIDELGADMIDLEDDE